MGTKLKKEIEVEELIIYPIFRKIIDAVTGKITIVFKVDEDTITKVVCGEYVFPQIRVFENNIDTLSIVYWDTQEATEREYVTYLQQVKENIK